ncbi:MAG: signal recognition particle-docking protein FtsY, partial [Bdellovibrionales bacterium]|nr:signal recognition particle-docking protein FtsY [Bdellovibrionales bacterium]
ESDPAAIAYRTWQLAKEKNAVGIIDSAGRMHTKSPLMDQLKKIVRVLEKDTNHSAPICLLVLDGTLGQNSILQAREFQEIVKIDGVILTKMDGQSKAGFIFQVWNELKVPVYFLGVGERPDDLLTFDTKHFIDQILAS